MKVWEATIAVLKETDNDAVMYGDCVLLHQIAAKLGWPPNGRNTEKRVLDALTKTPGPLRKKYTAMGHNDRLVRLFRMPEEPAK